LNYIRGAKGTGQVSFRSLGRREKRDITPEIPTWKGRKEKYQMMMIVRNNKEKGRRGNK